MIHDVLRFAAERAALGQRVALVTVTATRGSSPASPGQMMAVPADGACVGTVGGGASEHRIIKQAAEAIASGTAVFSFSFDHADEGMTCGGGMEGFGTVLGSAPGLCIFGGGHIAQALAKLALLTGFRVTVVEERPELAGDFDGVRYIVCKPHAYEAAGVMNANDYAVVCTRGHRSDAEALRYCLHKPLRYLGMIGSRKKAAGILETMRGEGISSEALDRVFTPIGLDIAGEIPSEIAVAILAEILLAKNAGSPAHKRG